MKPRLQLTFILLILFVACDDDDKKKGPVEWRKLGLDGKTVNEIHLSGDNIYVATTTGLFRKPLHNETGFSLLGFDGKNVEALEIIGETVLIASLVDKSGSEEPSLHRSADGGETWEPVSNDFGGDSPEPVYDLAVHSENTNTLYAAGSGVVAKSLDGGHAWSSIYGEWGALATGISVVEVNPFDHTEIWAGGQGAIENGFLIRSVDETNWDRWDELVENPSVVKEIVFPGPGPNRALAGWEGALTGTSDGGEHWATLINSEENRFYFGIAVPNGKPDRIYAGGWLKTKDPQPFILYLSENGGTTWEEFSLPQETYGGIMDMKVRTDNTRDVLYVGLDQGGVYEVTISF